MKCPSVRQPFAGLLVQGAKTMETRTWATDPRGRMLVHAAIKPGVLADRYRAEADRADRSLLEVGGAIIGSVEVIDCRPMRPTDEDASLVPYDPGLYVWVLRDAVRLPPTSVRGRLRLFEIADWEDTRADA